MPGEPKTDVVNTLFGHDYLPDWANEFYRAKRQEQISSNTQATYKQQLTHFLKFCDAQLITRIGQITAGTIRDYLLWLEEKGHNAGGQHLAYRVLKTFLRWYELQAEPEGWHNPIEKVKAPKLQEEPLDPVELDNVQKLVDACDNSFLGRRNKAILLCLLDTGLRARELLSLDQEHLDLVSGEIILKRGKGRKFRYVFISPKTRKAVRAYLKMRHDKLPALWVTDDQGDRLKYGALRKMIVTLSDKIGIDPPSPHDFRRAFALNMLQNGVDPITLARLMGHTSQKVLERYLKQLPKHLQEAHAKGSPVEHGL